MTVGVVMMYTAVVISSSVLNMILRMLPSALYWYTTRLPDQMNERVTGPEATTDPPPGRWGEDGLMGGWMDGQRDRRRSQMPESTVDLAPYDF